MVAVEVAAGEAAGGENATVTRVRAHAPIARRPLEQYESEACAVDDRFNGGAGRRRQRARKGLRQLDVEIVAADSGDKRRRLPRRKIDRLKIVDVPMQRERNAVGKVSRSEQRDGNGQQRGVAWQRRCIALRDKTEQRMMGGE